MRVLLLADRSFTHREHAMLRRLEIGLFDEGLRVCRTLPEGCKSESDQGLVGEIRYRDSGLPIFTPHPSRTILRDIRSFDGLRDSKGVASIDILHAWGEETWSIAFELSRQTGAELVLEVWSDAAHRRIPSLERRTRELHAVGAGGIWLAPDRAMLSMVDRYATRWPVQCSNWGVHVQSLPPRSFEQSHPCTISILATGGTSSTCVTCLTGLKRSLEEHPQTSVFLNAECIEANPGIWKQIRALGLLERVSLVSEMEAQRMLIVQTDILILPESNGEHRSLALEAMASGTCLIAASDESVECLDSSRAVLVAERTPGAWNAAISRVLGDPALRMNLGQAARTYIASSRQSHMQIESTLGAYRTLLAERPLPFAQSSGSDGT